MKDTPSEGCSQRADDCADDQCGNECLGKRAYALEKNADKSQKCAEDEAPNKSLEAGVRQHIVWFGHRRRRQRVRVSLLGYNIMYAFISQQAPGVCGQELELIPVQDHSSCRQRPSYALSGLVPYTRRTQGGARSSLCPGLVCCTPLAFQKPQLFTPPTPLAFQKPQLFTPSTPLAFQKPQLFTPPTPLAFQKPQLFTPPTPLAFQKPQLSETLLTRR